jgi:hypothetical protein
LAVKEIGLDVIWDKLSNILSALLGLFVMPEFHIAGIAVLYQVYNTGIH